MVARWDPDRKKDTSSKCVRMTNVMECKEASYATWYVERTQVRENDSMWEWHHCVAGLLILFLVVIVVVLCVLLC